MAVLVVVLASALVPWSASIYVLSQWTKTKAVHCRNKPCALVKVGERTRTRLDGRVGVSVRRLVVGI